VLASGSAQAAVAAKTNELVATGLDVTVGDQALVDRLTLEIKPHGADVATVCLWNEAAVAKAKAGAAELALPCRAGRMNATVRLREAEPGVVVVTLDLDRDTALAAEDGVRLTALLAGVEEGVAISRSEPWWTRPVFWKQQGFIPDETQLVMARRNVELKSQAKSEAKSARKVEHVVLLPLPAGGAMGWVRGAAVPFSAGGVTVALQAKAAWSLRRGALAVIGAGDSPYDLLTTVVRHGLEAIGKPARLRTEKPYPEPFKRVGFCTWNTLYENQTTQNLMATAKGLADARFPLGFFIIDSGWQPVSAGNFVTSALRGFEADAAKIPNGLKALVSDLRRVTGASWIGVWHTLQGVPGGVDPKSPLAKAEAAHLWQGNLPALVPDPTSDRGAEFFRNYYKVLRAAWKLVTLWFSAWKSGTRPAT